MKRQTGKQTEKLQQADQKIVGTPRTREDTIGSMEEEEEEEANKGCSGKAARMGDNGRDVGTSRQRLKVRETISNHHPSPLPYISLFPFRPLLLFRISYRLSGRADKTRRRELGEPSVARHDR